MAPNASCQCAKSRTSCRFWLGRLRLAGAPQGGEQGRRQEGGRGQDHERQAVALGLVVHPAGEHRADEPAQGGDDEMTSSVILGFNKLNLRQEALERLFVFGSHKHRGFVDETSHRIDTHT